MTRQVFDTRDVLALEIETHATLWSNNHLDDEHGLADWFCPSEGLIVPAHMTDSGGGFIEIESQGGGSAATLWETRVIPTDSTRRYVRFSAQTWFSTRSARARYRWHDSSGRVVGTTGWTTVAATGDTGLAVQQLPTYAKGVSVQMEMASSTGTYPADAGGQISMKGAMFFGTSANVSAMSSSSVDSITPRTWTDVLPISSGITVNRYVLEPGSLTCRVPISIFQPTSTSSLVRAGRRVRLVQKATGRRLFSGWIAKVDVEHRPERSNVLERAIVTFRAEDSTAVLAHRESRYGGGGRFYGVAMAVEGTGVVWTGPGGTTNEKDWPVQGDGRVLDLLTVARDTSASHVWEDANGVMQAWAHHQLPGVQNGYWPGARSVNGDTSLWSADTNVQNIVGMSDGSIQLTSSGASGVACQMTGPTGTAGMEVTPGETIRVGFTIYPVTQERTPLLQVRFYSVMGTGVGAPYVAFSSVPGNTQTTIGTTFTVPAGAHYATAVPGFTVAAGTGGTLVRFYDVSMWSTTKTAPNRAVTITDSRFSTYGVHTPARYNQITVTNGTDTYGPYVDHEDLQIRGPQPISITVAPLAFSETWARRFAAQFMGRHEPENDVTEVRGISFGVRNSSDYPYSDLDLYDRITVANTTLSRTTTHRISGISHTITPKKWVVEYDLSSRTAPGTPTVSV